MCSFHKKWHIFRPKKQFFSHVTVLAGGTALGQAFIVLFSPILTRIYTPDALGILANFISLLSIFQVVLSLRYEQAIPLPEEQDEALALFDFCLLMVIFLTLVITFSLWILKTQIKQMLTIKFSYLLILGFGLIGAGLYQTFSLFALRKQAFGYMAFTRLIQAILIIAIQIGFGVARSGFVGLLIGEAVGRVICNIGFIPLMKTGTSRRVFKLPQMIRVAKRYIRFPLLNTWAALINVLSLQLPFILLPVFFTMEVTGFFALAYRALALPSILIGQAVGQVYFSKATLVKNNPQELAYLTERTSLALFSIAIGVFGIVLAGGPTIFGIVFGRAWIQAGIYAQILVPWYIIWLVSSPLSNIITVREWQGSGLIFAFIELASRWLALWMGFKFRSDRLTIILISFTGVIISLITTIYFLYAGYVKFRHYLNKSLPLFIGALAYIFSLWAAIRILGLWGFSIIIILASLWFFWWSAAFIKSLF